MITKRDLAVGLIAVSGTLCALAAVNAAKPIIGESVYDWATMKVTKTAIGETRSIVKGPTATLDELEMHVTTLNPGLGIASASQASQRRTCHSRQGNRRGTGKR